MGNISTQQFFDQILPTNGVIAIATPFKIPGTEITTYTHQSFDSTSALLSAVTKSLWEHKDVFFALGSFKEAKVWNPNVLDKRTGELGKFEFRTQANGLAMKCFFLDLDVSASATDNKHFPTKAAAIIALRDFCKKLKMPKPMVVDSGGGYHAYWPLTEEVPTAEWRVAAEQFKSICIHEQLPIDPSVPADSARVLRVPGTANFKQANARMVTIQNAAHGPYAFEMYAALFGRYVEEHNVTVTARKSSTPALRGATADAFGSNVGATNNPGNFDRIVFHCEQMANLQYTRGATAGYELWRAGLGVVKFCEPQREAALSISDQHGEFNEQDTMWRMDNWTTPPTTCAKLDAENSGVCGNCPHWQNITTPVQLGREVKAAPAPTINVTDEDGDTVAIELPSPPMPYRRTDGGSIVMVSEDSDGRPTYVPVCPNDLYPIRILRQTGVDNVVNENSVWRIHLDRMPAPVDVRIEQGLLSDARSLHKVLLSNGLYLLPTEAKETQQYMSAYIRHLSQQADREKIYERMGWHDDHASYVIGGVVVHKGGNVTKHEISQNVTSITRDGMHTVGTMQGWQDAMKFYLKPNSAAHRMFLYASFGAPLLHMTGHKGVLLSATGDSGRGKTTAARANHSVWGHPDALMINGNRDGSTQNAMLSIISCIHSLPVSIDDTTDQDPEVMARLMLNFTQGKDKSRMSGHEHNGQMRGWETIGILTTNADDVTRISSRSSGAEPHLMRIIPVPFENMVTSTETKIEADQFLLGMNTNYGHAGITYMQYVMPRYAAIETRVRDAMANIDRAVQADSSERFWTAGVAAIYVGALLAQESGVLVDFPIEDDLQWMLNHIGNLRVGLVEARVTPVDILNQYLEASIGNTLAMSAKSTTNIDNVALHPHYTLSVRHDLDLGVIHVSRAAISEYCTKTGANFRKVEAELVAARVVTNKNAQKVLGAGTNYAKGQVRCWVVDATAINGGAVGAAKIIPTLNTVVPMRQKGAAA
jgi:hypothetical protein